MKGLKKQIMPALGIAAGAVGGGFVKLRQRLRLY